MSADVLWLYNPVPDLRLTHAGMRQLLSRRGLFSWCSYLGDSRESVVWWLMKHSAPSSLPDFSSYGAGWSDHVSYSGRKQAVSMSRVCICLYDGVARSEMNGGLLQILHIWTETHIDWSQTHVPFVEIKCLNSMGHFFSIVHFPTFILDAINHNYWFDSTNI